MMHEESSRDFRPLLEHQPSVAMKLLEVLSRRLRVADERISQQPAQPRGSRE